MQASFPEFVADRRPALLGTAMLLTGDRAAAEELVQRALARAAAAPGRRTRDPEAVVLRSLVTGATSRWSRLVRTEQVIDVLPDPFAAPAQDAAELAGALRRLPARTRAVVVLRWHEQLPDARIAELLGRPVGAVAEEAAAGLAQLRPAIAPNAYERTATDVPDEQRLAAGLGRLAAAPQRWRLDPAAAQADVRSRRRQVPRRRLAVAGAAALLCAVAVAVPLVRSTPDPAPAPSAGPVTAGGTGTPSPVAPRTTPVLVGPARGSLAGDSGFLDALRQVGWGGLEPPAPGDREVVLAADTPDGRVALVVGTVLEDFRGVWLTGPVGAAPDELVPHLPQQLGRDRPVTLLLGGPGPATLVVVAGRQDEITVSERLMTGPRGTVGRSYVPVGSADGIAVVPARTTSAGPALSVRVAREGRQVYRAGVDWPGAQPGSSVPVPLPAPLRSSAVAPDPHLVDAALTDLAVPLGVEPAALQPELLWSGALPLGHGAATVAVVVAHSPGGALVVTTWAGGSAGAGTCGTQTPPGATDVASLTVARICDVRSLGPGTGDDGSWLVVTAPPEAVSAEVLDGDGRAVGVLALQSGGAVEPLPAGARSVRTLDATGRSVHDIPIAPRPTAPFGDFGTGPEG